MKGLIITGVLLVVLVFSGMYKQHQLHIAPYDSDQDDIGVMSGYNHIHVVIENEQFVRIDVYNKQREKANSYSLNDMEELFPSAKFIKVFEENERLFAVYMDNEKREANKKLVVGARGTLQFAQERR
ncbi:hypothetical protein [Alkalihalobacillus sp. R86527]|uniref:hypothetical protein n=1 Tax=Alkalihalobacillus sp. R86527 TaxID=3093863 RepID=UPI00367282D5